jgi:UDPglucose 6-dehydrogenase
MGKPRVKQCRSEMNPLPSEFTLGLERVNPMKMAVIGTGYLGATHAACMASLGHEVIGLDSDERKLARLRSGKVPFFEPGLDEMVFDGIRSGRLRFTSCYSEVADFTDIFFIAVGTPQKSGEFAADVSALDAVIEQLAPRIRRPGVILGKSTVPVGTAERLRELARDLSPSGSELELAWNPEFLREGRGIADTLRPDRLVLGLAEPGSGRTESTVRQIYQKMLDDGVPLIVTDLATAELVKIAANAFLATKISFINAVSEVCDASGADIVKLADAIGYDPRIGRAFLDAGLGFGGGCLPKDIRAFMARAQELGSGDAVNFLSEIDAINNRRRIRMVELTAKVCGALSGARIAVLGAAFKPDSDDIRDSPALHVASQLHANGAEVVVYDPKALENSRRQFPDLGFAESAEEACRQADAVLVLTEWQEFRDMDPVELGRVVRHRRLIDGRNCLDVSAWQNAGWDYRAYGRRVTP